MFLQVFHMIIYYVKRFKLSLNQLVFPFAQQKKKSQCKYLNVFKFSCVSPMRSLNRTEFGPHWLSLYGQKQLEVPFRRGLNAASSRERYGNAYSVTGVWSMNEKPNALDIGRWSHMTWANERLRE